MDKVRVILALLQKIPKGKVTTNHRLATAAGFRDTSLVDKLLSSDKLPERFPCHRVVNPDGSIVESYAATSMDVDQFSRLKKEGVSFDKNTKKVDFRKSLYVFTSA